MARHCFALDLKDDPELIAAYEHHHRHVWPEILNSLAAAGIESMEIYRTGNRLLMIMETNASFSFEKKAAADAADARVQEWEQLMWRYQQALPHARAGEKWIRIDKIFNWSTP
jgi:L-rhamnose mutarotase